MALVGTGGFTGASWAGSCVCVRVCVRVRVCVWGRGWLVVARSGWVGSLGLVVAVWLSGWLWWGLGGVSGGTGSGSVWSGSLGVVWWSGSGWVLDRVAQGG